MSDQRYNLRGVSASKEDVHNARLHRIIFRQADEFSLKAEEVPIMV